MPPFFRAMISGEVIFPLQMTFKIDRTSTYFNRDQDLRKSGFEQSNGTETAATAPPGIWS